MKSASIFCAIAMVFYALEISITDWKLTQVSPRLLTFCYSLGVATCAGVSLLFLKEIRAPEGQQWLFIVAMVAASFVAAWAHFAALNLHAGAVQLTLFYSLMPVAASAFTAFFKGELPSLRMVLAWAAAALALYLMSSSGKEMG
jgi:drug/metabolite transporter (DMT)-like permease